MGPESSASRMEMVVGRVYTSRRNRDTDFYGRSVCHLKECLQTPESRRDGKCLLGVRTR